MRTQKVGISRAVPRPDSRSFGATMSAGHHSERNARRRPCCVLLGDYRTVTKRRYWSRLQPAGVDDALEKPPGGLLSWGRRRFARADRTRR